MTSRQPLPRTSRLLTLAAIIGGSSILLTACGGNRTNQSTASETGAGAVTGEETYITLYRSGQYSAARSAADAAARRSTGVERERAQLVQGMSAHALGQRDEAERVLTPLVRSQDNEVSARAEATLGLIAKSKGMNEKAASLLANAAAKLHGDDAAQAYLRAGDSLAAAGQPTGAAAKYRSGIEAAATPALKETIESRLDSGAFTVQLGVYAQKMNADRAAADAGRKIGRSGVGAPRVSSRKNGSKTEYIVHVGSYDVRFMANAAQAKLGQGVVASMASAN